MKALPTLLATGALTALVVLGSCGGGEEPAPKPAPVVKTEAQKAADTKFELLCSTCHGKTGLGDGPAAANLDLKPRDYTDKTWQGSVDDAYLAKIILEGGAAVGKSAQMPPAPDLKDKPEVVDALVAIVRSFAD